MTVPKTLYSVRFDRWYVEDEYSGKYGEMFPALGLRVAAPDLPEDALELTPADEADRVFGALNQLELELCDILGLDWLLINWGDIQREVSKLVNREELHDGSPSS